MEAKARNRESDRSRMEDDARVFAENIEKLAARTPPGDQDGLRSFADAILNSGDPIMIRAFRDIDCADWKL